MPGRNAVSGLPPSAYPFRGVRTGHKAPPTGYAPTDFRIPTLREVFQAFPKVPINIEIKGRGDTNFRSFLHHAELLAAFLTAAGRHDVIVVSFNDLAIQRFHRLAPGIGVAPGIAGIVRFKAGLSPGAGVVALQVPPRFEGVPVASPDFVRDAHARGYAVHVWPSDGEDDAFYNKHIDMCADGLMPSRPGRLEALLQRRQIVRPGLGGIDPCGPDTPRRARPACAARSLKLGRLRRGRVRLRLRRTGVGRSRCEGSVSLRTKRRFRLGAGGRRTLRVARTRFVLPAGRTRMTVTLGVSRRGRRLVHRRGRLGVTAHVRMRGGKSSRAFALR